MNLTKLVCTYECAITDLSTEFCLYTVVVEPEDLSFKGLVVTLC